MAVLTSLSYVCIHGHFYQPPREDPFTGLIDEPSAAPHQNWNARIDAECYRPNTAAPILKDGVVERVVNNYEWISFDFGPTLLDWLERHDRSTYDAVISSDRRSQERFSGHGAAIAHPYDHLILPLANARDKRTQVRWGIADFEHRFGRAPEGMWLPETAVDLETLRVAEAEGIRFTILSPQQAGSVRGPDGHWADVSGGRIDSRSPYLVDLGAGRTIAVFFYDGPMSVEIAFDGVLDDGTILARRLAESVGEPFDRPALAHVATDGETYGHHHRHGEMALAKALDVLGRDPAVAVTNYGEFLALHPPRREARIVDGSSWSCAHGIERWRADCGCHTGPHPEWHQAWRGPLRAAFDHLRDRSADIFEEHASELFEDPWGTRDAYVDVLLGGDEKDFVGRHSRGTTTGAETTLALDLLEMQRHAMIMYTSCGWFFEDIAGLESLLVLRHAGRVVELARRAASVDLEPGLVEMLGEAKSNIAGRTGRDVYLAEVAPALARFDGR